MDTLPDVASHPLVVWAAVAAALIYIMATALAKAVPPLLEAKANAHRVRAEAAATGRRYRQEEEDARVLDLSTQVDHLAGRVWTLEQERERWRDALVRHAAWDHLMLTRALAAGDGEVTPPPPLWPLPE